jgi:hypothetical protein
MLNCPFCRARFAGETFVRCTDCATAHHAGCWITHGSCSVYGCRGSIPTVPARIRSNLGVAFLFLVLNVHAFLLIPQLATFFMAPVLLYFFLALKHRFGRIHFDHASAVE